MTKIKEFLFTDDLDLTIENSFVYFDIDMDTDKFKKIILKLIEFEFSHPMLIKKTPSGKICNESSENGKSNCIFLAMSNDELPKIRRSEIINQIAYVLQQFKENKLCDVELCFNKKTLKYFQNKCMDHHSELSGVLYTESVDSHLVHHLGYEEKHVGDATEVHVQNSMFNFHSHPEVAYIKNDVKNGWPSASDYCGAYKFGNKNIFHAVATLEGIYIITVKEHWFDETEQKKITEKFIRDNYDIDKKDNLSIDDYLKKINKIEYNGFQVFGLLFLTWNDSDKPFIVKYPKNGINCFSDESIFKKWKKLFV